MKNPIIKAFRRELFDKGDPFGSAMELGFAIAACVERKFDYTPRHWKYRAGWGQYGAKPTDNFCWKHLGLWRYKESALIEAGNIITRYTNLLERHGRSY